MKLSEMFPPEALIRAAGFIVSEEQDWRSTDRCAHVERALMLMQLWLSKPDTTALKPGDELAEALAFLTFANSHLREDTRTGVAVFFSHPYTDNPGENIIRAEKYAEHYCARFPGAIPYVPHLMFSYLAPETDEDAYKAVLQKCIAVLSRCDIMMLCGPGISRGMAVELEYAMSHDIPVYRLSTAGAEPVEYVTS